MLHIANGIQKKIFSLDIEKVLLQHSKIENCVVVPVEDHKVNQVPVAFVILKKGVTAEAAEPELMAYAEENLEISYRPVKYHFVEKFPLTKVGKVDHLALEKVAQSAK